MTLKELKEFTDRTGAVLEIRNVRVRRA